MINKRIISRLFASAMILLMLCSCSIKKPGIPPQSVAALPQENAASAKAQIRAELDAASGSGVFRIENISRIIVASADPDEGVKSTVALAADLYDSSDAFGKSLNAKSDLFSSKTDGDIVLIEDDSLFAEDYIRIITEKNIYLFYGPEKDCNGLLYGLQDILKLCMNSSDGLLKCGKTDFSPDTKERTLMLDCARKCWSVKWIKNLISEMSWLGFNALELHLTEDQGIRANIWQDKNGKTVPDCNGNDFSFLCGGKKVSWNEDYYEDPKAEYSRDDIVEIAEWAKRCHIDIIPSVDFPGHSGRLIYACESKDGFSFKYKGKTYSISGNEKISADGSQSNTVDISSESVRNLTYAVTEAYASFFKGFGCDRFDIASDEVSVDDSGWSEYARSNGGSTMFDGYIVYVNSLCDILKDMGYTVRANNDFLFSQKTNIPIDKELQICYWKPTDSDYGSAEYLISDGRTVFNCVESFCYYVLRQSKSGYDARSPECGWWDFHHSTAKRVFCGCGGNCGYLSCNEPGGWNPSKLWGFSSRKKTTASAENLGGAYFYIWGDWAKWDTEENIFFRQDELSLVRRLWSSSAKMIDWDADKSLSWDEFKKYIDKIEYSPLIAN
ncbi:MAG: family 20 glycosylhydrolase [Clostridia bacterium]|nr:family 20 glycosylhydrolase [Clostridia bacterium]